MESTEEIKSTEEQKNDLFALLSLGFGIAALLSASMSSLCCIFLPLYGLFFIGSIVLGFLSLKKISNDPTLKGANLAKIGMGISAFSLIIYLLMIFVFIGISAIGNSM